VSVETSIVIPTLDHASTIGPTFERLNRVVAASSSATEVLIVDAGSRDETLEIAAELADCYPLLHTRLLVQDREQAGFGTVLRLGMAYATGRFIVVVMPDARDPLELIPKMVAELRSGAHLVLCSRYGDNALPAGGVPRRFAVYQSLYRRAIRTLLGVDIPDSTYGFRAFSRTFVQALGITGRRFSVCSEITFKVILAGGRTAWIQGAQSGPMVSEQSRFRLGNELAGYAGTLGRAALHRAGLRWF
jgi:glycosyltransferase involved in cell wall biosynthesis